MLPNRAILCGVYAFAAIIVSDYALADCSRKPDYESSISGPSELVGLDTKSREFQFYSKSVALVIGESNYASWNKLPSVPHEMENLSAALEANGFHVTRYNDLDSDEIRSALLCFLTS